MTDRSRTTDEDRTQDTPGDGFRRREFVALGAGASATMLAGCAGGGGSASSDGSGGSDGEEDDAASDGSETLTGTFRLLISDAPADIGDFDSLDVTLDEARVFDSQDGEDDEEEDEGDEEDDETGEDDEEEDEATDDDGDREGNETDTEDDPENETAVEGDDDDAEDVDDEDDDTDDEDDDSDRGFIVVDLDGATVDLTQVIEEDAIAVFDGEIPAGSYEKIELSVSDVEGIVDGEQVDVKLPSEKLQITNGFEVTPDEAVSFVFDINVVKRGPNGYILRPVISGSGVAGRDVEVNEIDDETGEEEADDEDEDDDSGEDDEDTGEDDEDDDSAESGSETSNDENGGTGGNETRNGTDD